MVNANTVARAYRELEQAGTIATSPGRGSFVAESSAKPSADRYTKLEPYLSRLLDAARKLGYDAEELVTLVEQKARVTPAAPEARRR